MKPLLNCLFFSDTLLHCFYEPLLHTKVTRNKTHLQQQARMFPRVKRSSLFTVLVFWHSSAFTFFACGVLITVAMMSFNALVLQHRDKSSLFLMKEDTIQAVFILLRKKKFLS